jgi:hypothetical protein
MDDFGFIITRHVISNKTNEYWNNSIKCLRKLYPLKKIIVIDDNSNYNFVKAYTNYENIEFIQSEFPGSGELLPYYYFYKNKFFKNAVILHDSVFFHRRVNFEKFSKIDVLPFWHFSADKENYMNSFYLISNMKNKHLIDKYLVPNNFQVLGYFNNWNGCFGLQSYISSDFLSHIVNKYDLFELLNKVKTRLDRCCLERILGIIFYNESKTKLNSLLGNIHNYQNFNYSYDDYKRDLLIKKKLPQLIVKIWTGR